MKDPRTPQQFSRVPGVAEDQIHDCRAE